MSWGFGYAQADSVTINEVDVVAPAVGRGVASPVTLQSLDASTMRLLGISSVADAVKRFAGVTVRDYGGIGGMKTISLHSLGAQHTVVSFDGVPVGNTQAGQIDFSRLAANDLASVELIVGGERELLQSATEYAAAGVVALTTQRPRFAATRSYALRLGVETGSFGLLVPTLRWGQQISRRTVLSLSGRLLRADGNYPYTLHNGTVTTNEHRSNTDVHHWQGEMNLFHTFADSSRLALKASYSASRRGLPGAVILYADASKERLNDEDLLVQASYERTFSPSVRWKTRAAYRHSWDKYRDWGSQYQNGELTERNLQQQAYASATLGYQAAGHFSMALASDLSYNVLRNNVYVDMKETVPQPSRWTSVSALALRWQTARLKVDGSLAFTYATEHTEAGETPADKHRLTPMLSASWRVLPGRQLFLRAMWKDVFRVPSFNDLYYRRLGNIQLRPELAHEWSLGLTFATPPVHGSNYLTLTLDGYYNNVSDKIVAFPSTYVWRMVNYGKVDVWGLDVTSGGHLALSARCGLHLAVSATLQRAADRTDKASALYGSQLPYTPRVSGSGSAVAVLPWFSLGYSLLMQGSRYSMQQNKSEYRMSPFWEHSFSISRDDRFGPLRVEWQLKLTNITNCQYDIIKYYPMPGRQIAASAAFYL